MHILQRPYPPASPEMAKSAMTRAPMMTKGAFRYRDQRRFSLSENQPFCGKRQRTIRSKAMGKTSAGMTGEMWIFGKSCTQMR